MYGQGDETLGACEQAQEESAHALPPHDQCPPNDPSTFLQQPTLSATPSAVCPPGPPFDGGSLRSSRNKRDNVKPPEYATPAEPNARVSRPKRKASSDAAKQTRRRGGELPSLCCFNS